MAPRFIDDITKINVQAFLKVSKAHFHFDREDSNPNFSKTTPASDNVSSHKVCLQKVQLFLR